MFEYLSTQIVYAVCIHMYGQKFCILHLHQMSSLGLDLRLALLGPDLTLNPLQ